MVIWLWKTWVHLVVFDLKKNPSQLFRLLCISWNGLLCLIFRDEISRVQIANIYGVMMNQKKCILLLLFSVGTNIKENYFFLKMKKLELYQVTARFFAWQQLSQFLEQVIILITATFMWPWTNIWPVLYLVWFENKNVYSKVDEECMFSCCGTFLTSPFSTSGVK